MKFKDIIPEDVRELPGKTAGVTEKLRQFYADQLPQPYWDEYSNGMITDSPNPGDVHSVKDSNISQGEENAMSFDVDISFSKVPHETILREVAHKIKELGGRALDILPTREDLGGKSTVLNYRDGQSFGMAVVSTSASTDGFYPRHTLHFRRRQRAH